LAGRAAVFAITAKALKLKRLPEVDDAFATQLGLPDVAALRAKVSENLQREYDAGARQKVKRELLDALDPPADRDELAEAERRLSMRLPKAIRDFYLLQNGTTGFAVFPSLDAGAPAR
jgi:FKBP-type peptidyl-prolyl cis-trans isomerase (trigger factor)